MMGKKNRFCFLEEPLKLKLVGFNVATFAGKKLRTDLGQMCSGCAGANPEIPETLPE